MVRAKTPARTILVTDAIAAAGMPPGRYTLGGQVVELDADGPRGRAGRPNLAGSALRLDAAIGNTARFTGLPLDAGVAMASTPPCRVPRHPDRGHGARGVGRGRVHAAGPARRGVAPRGSRTWPDPRWRAVVLALASGVAATGPALAQAPPAPAGASPAAAEPPPAPAEARPAPPSFGLPLAGAEAEEFLKTAKVVDRQADRHGRDTARPGSPSPTAGGPAAASGRRSTRGSWGCSGAEAGGIKFDFRDSWKSEVAAYELDKLLGLGLVPPTVERKGRGPDRLAPDVGRGCDDRRRPAGEAARGAGCRGLERPDVQDPPPPPAHLQHGLPQRAQRPPRPVLSPLRRGLLRGPSASRRSS